MSKPDTCARLLEAAEHFGELRQYEYVSDILEAVDELRYLRETLAVIKRVASGPNDYMALVSERVSA